MFGPRRFRPSGIRSARPGYAGGLLNQSEPIFIPQAAPATIYVATNGNDSTGNGTAGNPYRTIGKAATLVNPGDIVGVQPGTYAETVLNSRNGTELARIRFVSAVRWAARIVAPSASTTAFLFQSDGDFVDIDGFEIDGRTAGGADSQSRIGIYLRGEGSAAINNHVHHVGRGLACISSGGAGIVCDASFGAARNININGNVVHHCGPVPDCQYFHGIYHSTSGQIHSNVCYSNSWCGITAWHDATNQSIVNNTVYGNHHGIGVGAGGGYLAAAPYDNSRYINNIVYNNAAVGIFENGSSGTNNICRYNLSVNNAGGNYQLKNGVQHTNDVVGDPLFIDAVGGDFTLQPGSPAIDAGDASVAPVLDILGVARVGAPDLGAYEFSAGIALTDPMRRLGTFGAIDANGSGYTQATGNAAFWNSLKSAPAWAQRDSWIAIRRINQIGDDGSPELATIGTFANRPEWLDIWSKARFSMINNCELEVVNPIKGTDPKGSSPVIGVGTIGAGDDGAVWHETNKPANARWRIAVMANAYPNTFPWSVFMVGNEPDGNINRLIAYAPGHVGTTIDGFSNAGFVDRTEALRRLALLAKNAWEELKTDKRVYTSTKHPSVVASYANTGGILVTTTQNATAFNIYQFMNYNSGEMLKYCQVIANHHHNFACTFDSPAAGGTQSSWHLWTALHQGQTAAGTGYVHPIYCNEGGVRRGNDDPNDLESLRVPQQTQWNEPPTAGNRLARQLLKVRRQGMMVCTIFYWAWSFWVLYNHNGSGDNGMIWCPSPSFTPREPEWTAIRRQFDPSLYMLAGRSPWTLPITAKPWADLTDSTSQAVIGFHDPATWAILGDIYAKEKADPASATVRTWYEWDRATVSNGIISFTAPVAGQGNQLNRAMRPVILPGHGTYYVRCTIGGNTGTARIVARGYNAVDGLVTTLGQAGSETTAASGTVTAIFTTVPHNVKNCPNLAKVAIVLECNKAAQFSNVVISTKPSTVAYTPSLGASIAAAPTSGPAPLEVTFIGTASGGDGSYNISWTFGDGGTAP